GSGFALFAGAFCAFGPAIFLPICLWNLWITRYVPRPPARGRRVRCGEGASVRRKASSGIPRLGEARRRGRKEREFPIRKHEGRPWAPFDLPFRRALALLVERRVDVGDLFGLERVAPGAVAIPVPALAEAEAEDAEVRAIA